VNLPLSVRILLLMAETQNAEQVEDGPPYPSFDERKFQDNKRPYFSAAYERLIWPKHWHSATIIQYRDRGVA
jgi:hypothetical protein